MTFELRISKEVKKFLGKHDKKFIEKVNKVFIKSIEKFAAGGTLGVYIFWRVSVMVFTFGLLPIFCLSQ